MRLPNIHKAPISHFPCCIPNALQRLISDAAQISDNSDPLYGRGLGELQGFAEHGGIAAVQSWRSAGFSSL